MMFEDMALENALDRIKTAEHRGNGAEMSALPPEPALAMAYIPFQFLGDTYGVDEGFKAGTIFPELDKPFLGGESR